MPIREEEVSIGNPGFRQYRYRVTWKGDTVVRMTPVGTARRPAIPTSTQRPVEIFTGPAGPGPLINESSCEQAASRNPPALMLTMDRSISGTCGDVAASKTTRSLTGTKSGCCHSSPGIP